MSLSKDDTCARCDRCLELIEFSWHITEEMNGVVKEAIFCDDCKKMGGSLFHAPSGAT